jgi:hypothetical protein
MQPLASHGASIIEELDVWRAAKQMMDYYPDEPAIHAARRADKALAEGDTEGFSVWNRITKAIEELCRKSPRDSGVLN